MNIKDKIKQLVTHHADDGTSGYLLSEEKIDELVALVEGERKAITHQWNKCEQKLDGTTEGALKCIEAFRNYLQVPQDYK